MTPPPESPAQDTKVTTLKNLTTTPTTTMDHDKGDTTILTISENTPLLKNQQGRSARYSV
jgi:hypothetical protein